MITEQDLQEAIAECQGVRNPTASTCLKLAAYYTIQDRMSKEKDHFREATKMVKPEYSFASNELPARQVDKVSYSSDTEFSRAIFGMDSDSAWEIMDELMSVLEATNPRLYNGVMRKFDA